MPWAQWPECWSSRLGPVQQPTEHAILIIGGGIAGLSTALRLADAGHRLAVVTKTELSETASYRAQGGIAAVMAPDDSLTDHKSDTVRAGAGLCHADIVERVVGEGPDCIRWLEDHGVRFTRRSGGAGLHLTREGGHSQRRIVHADDATGRAVMGVLAERVRQHPAINLLENRFAARLLTSRKIGMSGVNRCVGATLLDTSTGNVETVSAGAVVVATGGASGVYKHATNASGGDGIAMAWRAGCRIANMEFVQFHPSCLHVPEAQSVLITEALRGEGARLLLPDGTRFMGRHDARRELAPRDVVSRAIVHEMAATGCNHVLLDISHKPAAEIRKRFPNIVETCRAFGFDLTAEPIPVVPAAHYTCGGVITDASGQTDLRQLYAVGEVGFTGLHGANRLASNSLLEALAFAKAVSGRIHEQMRRPRLHEPCPPGLSARYVNDTRGHDWAKSSAAELRQVMWERVGIVRTRESLKSAAAFLDDLQARIDDARDERRLHLGLLELGNLATVSRLIADSAARRQESRGLHYNRDYPLPARRAKDSALQRGHSAASTRRHPLQATLQ